MYNDLLKEAHVELSHIFLDPNNPRFWSEKNTRDTADKKIPDKTVQTRTRADIEKHGIEELSDSILRNGFLPMDRIVVRPIDGHKGKYVVVEGNRRLAALIALRERIENDTIDEEHIDDDYLKRLLKDTSNIEVLIYHGDDRSDIAWLLQGIRHISGIRDWSPAQRARLVATQIDNEGLGFREAGQKFGLSAQAVGRYYRSYKALQQMRSDDEYQGKAKNEYFTLFEEVIRNKDVKTWLGWDDNKFEFQQQENLEQFYSWIVPDDDRDGNRRIHDPRQIKKLGYLIAGKHATFMNLIDQHEIGLDAAYERAIDSGQATDWQRALDKAEGLIIDVPNAAARLDPDQIPPILEKLDTLTATVARVRQMVAAAGG